MDFATLPPEINSGRMYSGPGSGPFLAAAAAWDGLAAELHTTAASYWSVVSSLAGGPWRGPASASMAAAAAPYVWWISVTAAQAEQAPDQARAAASAYETAFATIVPPPLVTANRTLLTSLVATNIFGQNTPAIAATEAEYAEMWGQDAAAMYGYAGSSAAASTLTSFTPPPPITDPGCVAAQTATVAQSVLADGKHVMSVVPRALLGLSSVAAAADPPGASALTTLATLVTSVAIPVAGIDTVAAATSAPASFTSGPASMVSAATTFRGLLINADRDFADGKGPYTGNGPGGKRLGQWLLGGTAGIGGPSDATEESVTAGAGQGTTVGRLSVPSGWASAAPAFRPAAYVLPTTGAEVASEMVADGPGSLFADMALAGAAGRAVGGASLGCGDQRIRATNPQSSKPPQQTRAEPVAEIAAELSGLAARAQSLLAKLANSGLINDREVAEQKRRFLGS